MSEELKLWEKSVRDLLPKIDKILTEHFAPQYTEYPDNKKEQNNPYTTLTPGEQHDVVIESCSLLIALTSATVMIKFPGMDQVGAMAAISRRIKSLTEQYHKQLLAEMEAKEQLKKDQENGTNDNSQGTAS